MSTMHRTNNTSSPWSSPKDLHQNPLKRRHTRGTTHTTNNTSNPIRSLSLSPAVSSVSLSSDSPNTNPNNMKTSPGFKTNNHSSQPPPHSARRNTDFQHHDFSHHDLNSSYHDFHPQQQPQHQRDDTQDRGYGSSASVTGTVGKGNFVPSWFGSLRSFAISATTSSRGAFAPLSTSSSSSSSSSTSSSPKSSKISRGRSSSIYYSSTRLYDDDDDDDNESGGSDSSRDDEPVTDLNGLKENRVRGPRVNWMALDPSLGSFFAGSGGGGGAYKPLTKNESDPDLNGSGCEGGGSGGRVSGVEDLGIAEAPSHDNPENESGDEGRGGSGRSGSDSGRVRTSASRAKATTIGDDSNCDEDSAWARAMDMPESGVVFTMPMAAPASTLAFLKSYVPSLGGGSDSTTSPTTTSPTTTSTVSPTSPAATTATAGGGGFWSLRKLSMNFLSGNQYCAVGNNNKSALTGEDEHDDGEEEEGDNRPREQGRRAGYRDDYDGFDDYGDGQRRKMEDVVGTKEMTPMTPPTSAGASGGLTVSYLASMVSNATQAGVQYIPVQVRDQLPAAVVSSRSSFKKD